MPFTDRAQARTLWAGSPWPGATGQLRQGSRCTHPTTRATLNWLITLDTAVRAGNPVEVRSKLEAMRVACALLTGTPPDDLPDDLDALTYLPEPSALSPLVVARLCPEPTGPEQPTWEWHSELWAVHALAPQGGASRLAVPQETDQILGGAAFLPYFFTFGTRILAKTVSPVDTFNCQHLHVAVTKTHSVGTSSSRNIYKSTLNF